MERLLAELAALASPATAAVLPRLFAASPFAAGEFARQRDWAQAALHNGEFERALAPVAERLALALAGVDDEAGFMRELRAFRNREKARIVLRELAGFAGLAETLGALSSLAEACCAAALEFAGQRLRARHGTPRAADGSELRPIVLGMGKLGGGELNFSSDIDLIFAYSGDGACDGEQHLAAEEYFSRLAQDCGRLLSARTEDGFVFRVDTLLRPFGSAGAPALRADAVEHYYQHHGREWERYALVKARPVAGDLAAGAELLQQLQPFVYRRYLDFAALGALRELKVLIDQDAHRRGAEDDLKLGPGGIRELEFIVQLFQLVRGGQDQRLRDPRLRTVLRYLGESGQLPAATAAELDRAYVVLRRCENAVQMYTDEQVHRLPQSPAARAGLCAALGMADWPALLAWLAPMRARVREEFERLFGAHVATPDVAAALWERTGPELEAALRELGYRQRPQDVVAVLEDLRNTSLVRALGDAARERLRAAVGLLAADAAGQDDAETALIRALRVVAAVVGRGTYVALLRESGGARRRLLGLAAASPWITELLAQTPALLDTLLDPRLAAEAPDREELIAELATRGAALPAADGEAQLDLLRRYRQEMTLRIAAADLSGALPLVQVSDRLTWLAEAIVNRALDCARAQLDAQYGAPAGAQFAILAYGKFGSIELGYGSDLDLVFVYQAGRAEESGSRLASSEYFSRLAQRVVHWLSAFTTAGRAYEVDLQLRPSGNSGLVVTSLAGFSAYQRDSAWTWEHQALLRARSLAGDAGLRGKLERIRLDVLCRPREQAALREEVVQMRLRMRASLERHQPGCWDVKQGSGGLIDAEFLTQYLCLRDAAARPALVEYTDNWRQLEALAAAGVLSAEQKERLLAAERAYRGWLHRRALQSRDGLADDGEFVEPRAAVSALWRQFLEGA